MVRLSQTEVYSFESGHHMAVGISIAEENFATYLSTRVHKRHYDEPATDTLATDLSSIGTTGFAKEELSAVLAIEPKLTPSSVGETFAECYLEDYHDSRIPYPHRRDSKNPRSEPSGADIVGFSSTGDTTVFLFGEIKTSREDRHPPSVVTNKSGLYAQMNAITSSKKNRSVLIGWLLRKIKNTDYSDWLVAFRHYKCNEFKAIGVLVRSTRPDKRDIQYTLDKIETTPGMLLDVLALYIPVSLTSFVRMVATT